MSDEQLEEAFVEELAALDRFRIAYTGAYPKTPLAREDHEVRRLLEGMAMFSARTRLAAERGLKRSFQRIFRQHFSYLLGPLPATGMLRAKPDGRKLPDPTELPAGAEVLMEEKPEHDLLPRGAVAEPRLLRMRTTRKLRILPISLLSVHAQLMRKKQWRLFIRLTSETEQTFNVGELSLHINHLDDVEASLAVQYALEKHLRSASVIFGELSSGEQEGEPCQVSFGPLPRESGTIERQEHPLREGRARLRFLRPDLYMHVRNIVTPRRWKELTICLDLDETWPDGLCPTEDSLELFVVPMVNERLDLSNVITCDGTRDLEVIRHPDDHARFVPSLVHAAYLLNDDGLVPIEPAVIPASLAGGAGGARKRDTYDVLYDGQGEKRSAALSLSLPGAFVDPKQVVAEAYWHQPALGSAGAMDFRSPVLGSRVLPGVDWLCSGPLSPTCESTLDDDRETMLELLSLRNQRFLATDELRVLLQALGVRGGPTFARIEQALTDARVASKPFARSRSGFKHVYHLTFEGLTPSDLPKLELFCKKMRDILITWSVDEIVELTAHLPNLETSKLEFVAP